MHKKFAIIGCGRIGQRHAEQIVAVGHLVAVCDIIPSRASEFAALYGGNPYYSMEDLLTLEKDIELLCICTPNGLHAQQSIKALEAGINVLCEKPLCINVPDGENMILSSQKAERKLFVVKQNRYNPPVMLLKELISSNKLGKVYSFQINCCTTCRRNSDREISTRPKSRSLKPNTCYLNCNAAWIGECDRRYLIIAC